MTAFGILIRIAWHAVFQGDKLASYIEKLDDKLTHKVSVKRREKTVKRLNRFLGFFLVRETLEYFLNKKTQGEKIDLNNEESVKRHQRWIPERENRVIWHNWMKNQIAEPLAYKIPPKNGRHKDLVEHYKELVDFDFEALNEVKDIIKNAEQRNLRVHCIASGHSLSDIGVTSDFMISTKRLTRPQRKADQNHIKPEYRNGYEVEVYYGNVTKKEKRYLFETGAGTLIVDLKQIVEKYGYALLNLGGSDVQGVVGAISTSTHGSGVGIGPYPSFVKSMVIVTGDAKTYRLEPSEGITDPNEYKKSNEYQQGIELKQDDDWFYSAVVSMGCFGVIISVTIEVMDIYHLHEERIPSTWEEEKQKLLSEGFEYINKYRHFELTVNPYPLNANGDIDRENGKHSCLITRRDYCDPATTHTIDETRRNYLSSLLSGITFAGNISSWIFNKNPKNIPKLITNSLKRIIDYDKEGGGYHGLYYDVLNQGLREMKFHGYAIEIGFSIDDNSYIDAFDRMLELSLEMAEKYEQYQPAPIALRFVDESPAYMSMMFKRKSCQIEVVSLKGVIGGTDVLERIEREMFKYNGRPHWGLNTQYVTRHNKLLEKLYPQFGTWLKIKNETDPKGTFNNTFTDRVGISNL